MKKNTTKGTNIVFFPEIPKASSSQDLGLEGIAVTYIVSFAISDIELFHLLGCIS